MAYPDNRSFATEYTNNFYCKEIPKPIPKFERKQFRDPLTEGFREYLTIEGEDHLDLIENCDEYIEKLVERNPKIVKHLGKPVDKEVVKSYLVDNAKTTYARDFCSFEDAAKYAKESENKSSPLPEGWHVAETTTARDYRKPSLIVAHAYKRRDLRFPFVESDNEFKVRRMYPMNEKSQYGQLIGKMGRFIVNNELHGPIDKPNLQLFHH